MAGAHSPEVREDGDGNGERQRGDDVARVVDARRHLDARLDHQLREAGRVVGVRVPGAVLVAPARRVTSCGKWSQRLTVSRIKIERGCVGVSNSRSNVPKALPKRSQPCSHYSMPLPEVQTAPAWVLRVGVTGATAGALPPPPPTTKQIIQCTEAPQDPNMCQQLQGAGRVCTFTMLYCVAPGHIRGDRGAILHRTALSSHPVSPVPPL